MGGIESAHHLPRIANTSQRKTSLESGVCSLSFVTEKTNLQMRPDLKAKCPPICMPQRQGGPIVQ